MKVKPGDKVRFQMPVGGVDTGTVSYVDGAYITIEVVDNIGNRHPIERYPNEVEKIS
jgi:hypothetical protein